MAIQPVNDDESITTLKSVYEVLRAEAAKLGCDLRWNEDRG